MKMFLATLIAVSALNAQHPASEKTAAAVSNNKSVIMIDPKARAADFVQAFDILRKDKPTLKISIKIANGMNLNSVSDVIATQGGTLLMIKYSSSSGLKYQIVPVEDIVEIAYSST